MAEMWVRVRWDGDQHWAADARPCRRCRRLTCRRDEQGRPCHRFCAEEEATAEVISALDGPAFGDDQRFANPPWPGGP